MLVGTFGRVLTVAVFAKKDHKEHKDITESVDRVELQAYVDRERFLLAELAAARCQVDKLLDQQQLLLNMIARLTGLGEPAAGAAAAPSVASRLPQLPPSQPLPASPRASPAVTPSPALGAPGTPPSPRMSATSSSSSSSDVPALTSLADLFKSAAAAAPNPASAAAAASIAAAVAAVDTGDILSISNFNIAPPQPPQKPSAAATVSGASAPSALPLSQPSLVFDTLGGFTAAVAGATASESVSSSSEAPEGSIGSEVAASDLPVEVAKAAPTDAPPDLVVGDDDIYWLSRLHAALEGKGFFPGDDDMENWYFGESTQAAVLTFQASERLPETGVVDRPTWTALLGAEEAEQLYARAPAPAAPAASSSPAASAPPSAPASPSPSSGSSPSSASSSASSSSKAAERDLTKWPVLMEGDGGREVHALQIALANAGFHCGEDDMRWWQFGDATLTALKYFQSCNSLPESGVCDERGWVALLGPGAQPADLWSVRLSALNSDDEDGGYEDDMEGVSQGRVWLLGEQRWERRA